MSVPPDAEARRLALDPQQSFICEAPAGSGKTELLTQRFLTLLGRVRKPEEILAITFTRKATGEMRERIIDALHMAKSEKPVLPHKLQTWELAQRVLASDAQYQWQLLQNPNRLQIKTFDSLCASLTRHLPLESTFGAMPQIAEDTDDLYRRAVRALLATLESKTTWGDALATVLQLLDNRFDRFENLMVQLLARREQWLPLMAYQGDQQQIRDALESALQNVLRDTVTSVRVLLPQQLQRDIVELAAFAAANLRNDNSVSPICHCLNLDLRCDQLPGWSEADIDCWHGIVSMLTTNDGKWRAAVNKRIGFPVGEGDAKKAFARRKQQLLTVIACLKNTPDMETELCNLRSLPLHQLSEGQWQILNALFLLLPVLTAQLTLVFRETNSIDFTELSLGARRALGELENPSQLALKLDYRLSHILVDEFQDTSAAQVELLNSLTAGWQPDDGRTLFCVGDAMQSIYGFRGANVGLFLNCREQGMANVLLQPLRLSANFRSQAGLVTWVNSTFTSAFPQHNNVSTGAVCYASSVPVRKEAPEQSVWVYGFIDHDDDCAEAQIILDVIQKNRLSNPAASIAILVRNREHIAHVVPLLQGAGLRYRAVELEPLQKHAVVQDLMALTRALLHPADRTAWLSVLRAPWCGMGLVDLAALANVRVGQQRQWPTVLEQCEQSLQLSGGGMRTGHQNDLFMSEALLDEAVAELALSRDGRLRLQRVLPILRAAQNNRERKTLRLWVEGTWLQLGGAACVEDATALENANVYFRLLETWEYASDLPAMDVLVKAVAKLYAAPDPEADERLQIMTIHKSKGLEFDVVIVPQLQRRPRVNEASLLMWHERLNMAGASELLMAPLTSDKGSTHPTYNYLRHEETKKSEYENCRLLYVACTRAREQLHLCAAVKQDPKDENCLKAPPKSSLLATIWEPLQSNIQPVYPATEPSQPGLPDDDARINPRALYRLATHWQFPALQFHNRLQAFVPPFEFGAAANRVDIQWVSPAARQIGTVIHQYLQRIALEDVREWQRRPIAQLTQSIATALSSAGTSAKALPEATEKVVQILENVLRDERAVWLLGNHHAFSACEYALTINELGGTQNLVLDRIFTEYSGTTWVVDYKTAEPVDGQTLRAFLQQQAQQYAEKMASYKRAVEFAGFSEVKTALYFPVMGAWWEFTSDI